MNHQQDIPLIPPPVTVSNPSPQITPQEMSLDDAIRIALANSKVVRVLAGHAGVVTGMAFNSDGGRLFTASLDRTVRVWDLATGRELARYEGHRQLPGSDDIRLTAVAAIEADGRMMIVTTASDGTAHVWDPGTAGRLQSPLMARMSWPGLASLITQH